MGLRVADWPEGVLASLRKGSVIPAHPLALNAQRTLDPRRQRALSRYYLDAGAGGLAVGVHTTQFAIREAGLYQPVLDLAMRTAREWTQQYEWYVHAADGKTAGLSDAIIQAVADGRRPEGMSEGMEIVYDFSNELNDFHSVTDRTYARMVAKYGEQGMMDLVGLNGYYSMISMVLNVGRTPLPPGNSPALKPFPK